MVKRYHGGYIEHEKGDVVFIQKKGNGKKYKIQYNGTGCYQAEIRGDAKILFKSNSNWFNPNFWYDRNNWLDGFGYLNFERLESGWKFVSGGSKKDVFGFDKKLTGDLALEYDKTRKIISKTAGEPSPSTPFRELIEYYNSNKYKDVHNSEMNKFVEKFKDRLIHKDDVLKSIFSIIEKKTKQKVELVGTEWFEAYIPVRLGGKEGIITWQNCD